LNNVTSLSPLVVVVVVLLLEAIELENLRSTATTIANGKSARGILVLVHINKWLLQIGLVVVGDARERTRK
jgi:hypothetical protein